jgi:Na+-driven multidrug efflux pump
MSENIAQRHFGAWAAIASVIALGNFLDFGLGSGAMNLIAGAKGRNASDEIAAIAWIAYRSIAKMALLLSLGLLAISFGIANKLQHGLGNFREHEN